MSDGRERQNDLPPEMAPDLSPRKVGENKWICVCGGCQFVYEARHPMAASELCPDCTDRAPKPVDQRGVGAKYDRGKTRWTLLPWDALEVVVQVLEHGCTKYGEGSWRHVPDGKRRYLDAAMRHLIASQTEANDSETGLPHLAHAACDVLFALSLAGEVSK